MAWNIRSATEEANMFSVPTCEPDITDVTKKMASTMLVNLLSNKTLCRDKDLFLEAMQEATESIIGKVDSLPPNRFARQERSDREVNFALPPKIDTSAKISTHHSPSRSSSSAHFNLSSTTSSSSSSSSSSQPAPLKIPLHHLSPLNKTASGPKQKEEIVNEFAKLREEKIKAIKAAKEREMSWKQPILTVYEEEEVNEDEIMSPAPTYESSVSNGSIESLLSTSQLSALKSTFKTLSPSNTSVASRTLLSTIHQSRTLRNVFSDYVIDEVCSVLRSLKGKEVTWAELLCFVVNPKGDEGFPVSGGAIDTGVSLDLSGLKLSGMVR
ncbi:hypothetical protein TrVE_jg4032 [Triparma verrucosa]|uniref:Uncharacterized protein n=1 Tax=Triparma verrucosa TaxID=1606542 RepID=A0A9W7EZA1_9STRA|nr:hypothetical protein TrVE_jg4032 [Triparma verrucosa]